jgi:hypothetical protein
MNILKNNSNYLTPRYNQNRVLNGYAYCDGAGVLIAPASSFSACLAPLKT